MIKRLLVLMAIIILMMVLLIVKIDDQLTIMGLSFPLSAVLFIVAGILMMTLAISLVGRCV